MNQPIQSCILVAEDKPDDVWLLRRALHKAGASARLEVARDGQEVIDYLIDYLSAPSIAVFPSVLLLDLDLPRRNGFEVLRWIRTDPRLSQLPVIVFSDSSSDCDIDSARVLGATEYCIKPTTADLFDEWVREFHGRWLSGTIAVPLAFPVAASAPSASGDYGAVRVSQLLPVNPRYAW